jgi:cytochrome c551
MSSDGRPPTDGDRPPAAEKDTHLLAGRWSHAWMAFTGLVLLAAAFGVIFGLGGRDSATTGSGGTTTAPERTAPLGTATAPGTISAPPTGTAPRASTAPVSTTAGGAEVALGEPVRGERIFESTCEGCHGVGERGGAGPVLQGRQITLEQAVTVIRSGKGIMPGGLVTGHDEADVAAYLETILEPG